MQLVLIDISIKQPNVATQSYKQLILYDLLRNRWM